MIGKYAVSTNVIKDETNMGSQGTIYITIIDTSTGQIYDRIKEQTLNYRDERDNYETHLGQHDS